MKVFVALVIAAALGVLTVPSSVEGAGFDLNGGSCEEADRKSPNGYFESNSEQFYGPVAPETLEAIPVECRPTSTSMYGAWYKVNVVGSGNMTLDSLVYMQNGPNVDLTATVLEGSCDLLSCVAPIVAALPNSEGVRQGQTTFNLKANTRYFIFFSVANVPGAAVPWIGLQTATAEAACNYYRSQQINFDSYKPTNGLGSCTPCEMETQEFATSSSGGTSISIRSPQQRQTATATVWKTTCIDACQRCYSVNGAPFCYTESRKWSVLTDPNGNVQPSKVSPCYNFVDGNVVCDQGIRTGACPLEVNGVECASCTNQFGSTDCVKGSSVSYSNFKVDCSNLQPNWIADKCLNTGFDDPTTSPALYNYGVYTDIVLGNVYGLGAFAQDISSTTSTCELYEDDGIPINPETSAPTPLPDDPLPLLLDDETDPFDIVQGQSKLFTIDVTGSVGILKCETKGDNGDADLYVGLDVVPLGTTFDGCVSELFGSDEECSNILDNDRSVANVIVFGYRAATDVRLECKLDDLGDARDFDAFAVDKEEKFDLKASEYRLYKMEVPSGAARVSCHTRVDRPTEDDVDMFMRIGGMPAPYVNTDCTSDSLLGDEDCELTEYISNNPLYILLKGFGNVTDARFTCEVLLEVCGECADSGDADELRLDERKSGLTLLENENRLFYFVAPENTKKVECWVETDNGDVDLYMRVGEVPVLPDVLTFDGGIYDCGSLTGGSGNEYCFYDWPNNDNKNPQRQNVYALLTGYEATKDISIKCDGDVPLTKDDARELRDGDWWSTNLAREEEKLAVMKVDERVDRMLCETRADRGDVDMYTKKDEVPKSQDGWDQTDSANSGSDESVVWDFCCGVDDGSNGDEEIYILLRGFDEVRDAEVRCIQYFVLRKDDARTLNDGSRYSTNLEKGEEKLFRFRVDEGVERLECNQRSDSGTVRMYSKRDEVPKRENGWDQIDGDDRIEWNFSGCVNDGSCGDEEIYVMLYAADDQEARGVEIVCDQFFRPVPILRAGPQQQLRGEPNPDMAELP